MQEYRTSQNGSANDAHLQNGANSQLPRSDTDGHSAKAQSKARAVDIYVSHTADQQPPRGNLSESHLDKLATISPEIIEARGYATVNESFPLENLGFKKSMNPALLIPWHNVHGEIAGYQIRPNVPEKDARGREQKYLFRTGHKNFVDVPPVCRQHLGNPKKPLYLVEGPIKADSLATLGACAVGLAGVYGWKYTNEQNGKVVTACFNSIALKDRIAYLTFDSDLKHKDHVQKAAKELKKELESRGATVYIVDIPDAPDGSKQGPDDFIRNGGTLEQLQSFIFAPGKLKTSFAKAEVEAANLEAGTFEFPLNDIGNGKRFAKAHGEALRYCSTNERWYFYENGIWKEDNHGEAERRAKATAQNFAKESAKESDDDKRARLLKHAVTLTKRATRETMLKDAASEAGMMITLEDFDTNLDFFNCANGTLNLKNREFWAHNPKDLLTKSSPVNYQPDAEAPLWRACVARWMPDEQTRDFVQEVAGVTLSGRVYEEMFMFLYGAGNNGKTKCLGILETILGTYFHKTAAETFMEARSKRSAGAPSQEVLELKGARLVTTHEIDEKHELNTTRIKDFTGRDRVTARGIYAKRETTFLPQFTLWMFGNGKPTISDSSAGMWRRPKLIDFGQPIPESERDPQLSQKLESELSGILNWALEGLARVEERGGKLITPEAVTNATSSYQEQENPLALFIEDRCALDRENYATAAELFEAWKDWCRTNSEEAGKRNAFGTALERQGFIKDKIYINGIQTRIWRGLKVWFKTPPKETEDNNQTEPEEANKPALSNLSLELDTPAPPAPAPRVGYPRFENHFGPPLPQTATSGISGSSQGAEFEEGEI